MVTTRNLQGDGQFRVIVIDHHLTRSKQFKLQTTAQTSLIDVRQQRIHFSLAGQLFFQLRDILLHLFALLLERFQANGLDQLDLEFFPQLNFGRLRLSQLSFDIAKPDKPQGDNTSDRQTQKHGKTGQYRPARWIVAVQITELGNNRLELLLKIDVDF